jgi:transposase-like protein
MEMPPQPTRPTWEHRLQAVLALLGGEPVPDVTARFGMGRSILYKWRRRALTALQGALTDYRPGPQRPANRLTPAEETPLVELAQRHPTWSAAQHPDAGRPSGALAPHHSTPALSLRVTAPAQTAGPLSTRPTPHVAGEARGPPPH